MSTKEEYEKPEILVCYFEQVITLNDSLNESKIFDNDNLFPDDF